MRTRKLKCGEIIRYTDLYKKQGGYLVSVTGRIGCQVELSEVGKYRRPIKQKGSARPVRPRAARPTNGSPKLLCSIEVLANQVRNCSHLKCQMLAERINAVVAQLRAIA